MFESLYPEFQGAAMSHDKVSGNMNKAFKAKMNKSVNSSKKKTIKLTFK